MKPEKVGCLTANSQIYFMNQRHSLQNEAWKASAVYSYLETLFENLSIQRLSQKSNKKSKNNNNSSNS